MIVKVVIVDDHMVVRQGLKALLEVDLEIEVVGIAVNGLEGIQQTRQLHPDVVLMDLLMPVMDGFEATAIIKREMPAVRVLILSSIVEQHNVSKALHAGADAYMIKGIAADKLFRNIKGVA